MTTQPEQYDKILFAGPVGAGKSSAIAALSEIPVVATDVAASDEVRSRKATTTVALDYGLFTLEDGEVIHLFGTPGQERFDFMWEILIEGALGLVILVDAARPAPGDDLTFFLTAFSSFINQGGTVIGITRSDLTERDIYRELEQRLIEQGLILPMLQVDARRASDVQLLLHTLFATLEVTERSA